MMLEILGQTTVYGILNGALYALVAVGISLMCANGPLMSFMYEGPKWLAGKTLTISAPAFQAL